MTSIISIVKKTGNLIFRDIFKHLAALNKKTIIVGDGSGWVIDNICCNMEQALADMGLSTITLEKVFFFIFRFFSGKTFYLINRMSYLDPHRGKDFEVISRRNNIVAVWWHSDYGNKSTTLQKQIEILKSFEPFFTIIQASCSIEKGILISHGIPEKKIVVVHEGIEDIFVPCTEDEKKLKKEKLGIPQNSLCIGSFQKDGMNWGNGDQPKLEKGPDIFIDVIKKLKKKHRNLFVILTGPARGYVINRLNELQVPFKHTYLEKYSDITNYYHVLDLYLITSRTEGGPKAILESMASGVPLISTKVGMAPDIITDGQNGLLADVEDVAGLAAGVEKVLNNADLKERLINNALHTVKNHSWDKIALNYYNNIHSQLNQWNNLSSFLSF